MFAKTRQRSRDAIGWLTYKLVRALLWLAMRVKRVNLTVSGMEQLPSQGPYVLVIAPHTSFFDGPVTFAVVRRRLVGVGMAEILDWTGWQRVFGWLFRLMGHIPVQRDNKESRDQTLADGIATLWRGIPVMIAAEGGIDRPFWRDGYARMAWAAQAPVVLLKLYGMRKFMDEGPDGEWIFDFSAPMHVAVVGVLNPKDYMSALELHVEAQRIHEEFTLSD